MAAFRHHRQRASDLDDIKFTPLAASLQQIASVERRNVATREALTRRIRSEFREMPGLCLTLPQATRLFDLRPEACSRILLELVENGLLSLRNDGRYVPTGK